jgi:NitT/TauT family transport system permease protein
MAFCENCPPVIWRSALAVPHLPRPRALDIFLFAGAGALLYALLALAPAELGRASPSVTIDLRPTALPGYTWFSILRMVGAYALSLVFTVVVGYAAARNPTAERILVPLLDILQSIPVLSFLPAVLLAMIAIFPRETLGLEMGSVLLIFTGMAWNMAFSFYHSLLTIPADLIEASRVLRLTWWQRLTTLEIPPTVIGLVWNSMMSWAGGWFFLMACESFTLVNRSFTLPGLGSYLAVASSQGDLRAVGWGLGTLVFVIVVLDQIIWRPLIVWSQRFKIELTEDPYPPHSWFLDAVRRSTVLPAAGRGVSGAAAEAIAAASGWLRMPATPRMPYAPRLIAASLALLALALIGGVLIGCVALLSMLSRVSAPEWRQVVAGAGATSARVAIALLIALGWTVPAGVFIGLRPRAARVAQPLAQIAASVPATALFPILLLVLVRMGGGLNIGSILLMLLGSQWYVLFNVIAGTSAIPQDLIEASAVTRLRGWMRWRTLWLPAIFPYLATGGITAQGGAWNASIVSEYVVFGGRTLQTVGLGALIAGATQRGNYPLLAASTLVMAAIVVLLNRLGWRRVKRAAEQRYHL